jgi:hypothetical protein
VSKPRICLLPLFSHVNQRASPTARFYFNRKTISQYISPTFTHFSAGVGKARNKKCVIILHTFNEAAEAEFLDVIIGTKVLRIFLLAIHSHEFSRPFPLSKVV